MGMPSVQEVHLVNQSNVVLDLLKVLLPGLIGAASAMIGIWVGSRAAAQTARRTWEWDAKRDGYLRLFPAAQNLAFHAGLVMMAANRSADEEVLEGERERFRSAFATLNAAAVVSRVTASTAGKTAINELVGYLRVEVNPFLHARMPDPVVWTNTIEPDLTAKLDALEAAASTDLENEPTFVTKWPRLRQRRQVKDP